VLSKYEAKGKAVMAVTIDRISAEVLASLAMEDIRRYAERYPESFHAYKAAQALNTVQQTDTDIKPRNSGKASLKS